MPKIKLISQKKEKNLRALGAPTHTPLPLAVGTTLPSDSQNSPLLQISGCAPGQTNRQYTKVYFGIIRDSYMVTSCT